jgi:DNA-binding beta-propeller fold protein YncE
MVADARVRQVLVLDLADPANPVQLSSIAVGSSTGHHGDALSGDGRWLFVANNADGSVSQIDVASLAVVRTFETAERPQTLGTFGATAGPSEQTGPIH